MNIKRYIFGVNKRLTLTTLITILLAITTWVLFNFLSVNMTLSGDKDLMNSIKQVKLVNSDKEYKGTISEKSGRTVIDFKKDYKDYAHYQLAITTKNNKTQIIEEPLNLGSKSFLLVNTHTQGVLDISDSGNFLTYTTKDFSTLQPTVAIIDALAVFSILLLLGDWVYLGIVNKKEKINLLLHIKNPERIRGISIYDKYLKTKKTLKYENIRQLPVKTNEDGVQMRVLTTDTRKSKSLHRIVFKVTLLDFSVNHFLVTLPEDKKKLTFGVDPVRNIVTVTSETDKLAVAIHPFKISEPKR